MSDNILSDAKIKEINLDLNHESNPKEYISGLLIEYPNSYFLQALNIFFETDTSRILYNASKLEGKKNTFALFGVSIKYRYDSDKRQKFIALIKESIQNDPNKINRWSRLVYYDILYDEDSLEASKLWKNLKEMYPDFLYLVLANAEILRTSGMESDALELMLKYEEKYSTANTDIFCKIGECYLSLNKYEFAEMYFNKSLKTKENAYAYNGLSYVFFLNTKYEKAKYYSEKAISIIPDESEFCWRYAIVLNLLHQTDSSYIFFKKAIDNCYYLIEKEQFYVTFIDCLIGNKEYTKAKEEFELYRTEYSTSFYENKYDIVFSYFIDSDINMAKNKYFTFLSEFSELAEEMDIQLNSIGIDMRLLIKE